MGTLSVTTHYRRLVLAMIAASLIPLPVSADCTDTSVDTGAVRSLMTATSLATLDNQFAHVDQHDLALVAVYRKRRLVLSATKDEQIRYLESLPTTRSELSRVYALTDSQGICEDPFIIDVVYNMFDTAARIIRGRGRFHRRFIGLCDLTDGEIGEVAWPAFNWLLKKDTARTVAALRSLSKETRTRLCDGQDPIDLTDRDAAKQCRSEL